MKNVMIVEPGPNCEFAVFEMTDAEFQAVFPGKTQNVEFIEDLVERVTEEGLSDLLTPVWKRRIRKSCVQGIHGTLFYQMADRKEFYVEKNDEAMVVSGFPMSDWHRGER